MQQTLPVQTPDYELAGLPPQKLAVQTHKCRQNENLFKPERRVRLEEEARQDPEAEHQTRQCDEEPRCLLDYGVDIIVGHDDANRWRRSCSGIRVVSTE